MEYLHSLLQLDFRFLLQVLQVLIQGLDRTQALGFPCLSGRQNFIIDLALDVIEDPIAFGQELDHVVGVVEHGLFNQMVDKVIVAGRDGVQILTSRKEK